MEVVPVNASSRVEWVRGEQQHVPRIAARLGADLVHSLASTAPLWGRVPRVTTIHDLNYLLVPEAHFGLRALGHARAGPGVRAAVAARDRGRRVHARRPASGTCARRRRRSTSSRWPPGRRAAAATPEAELRARLGLGDRPIVAQPRRQAPAQEPDGRPRRAVARLAPRRAPGARRHRLPDAVRRRAARPTRRALGSRATSSCPRGSTRPTWRGSTALASASWCSSRERGLRPARAGGDGARGARRHVRPLVDARGRRRRGGARRPGRCRRDRRRPCA